MSRLIGIVVLMVAVAALAACASGGGQPAAGVTGNAANGQALFQQTSLAGNPGCVTCHSTTAGQTLVGPSLAGIATTAEQTIKLPDYHGKAKTGEERIRECIMDPSAYIVPGFSAGVMPANWGQVLSAQQIADLVAYLETLK